MKYATDTLVILAVIVGSSLSHGQNPSAKSATPPPPITPKDVRVLPYSREHEKTSLDGKRGHPDELRVVTSTNKVHLYGTKRVESMKVDGRLICHSGKLALLPPTERKGKVFVKVPPADDVTFYYGALELTDGTLDTKQLKAQAKKEYAWSFTTEAGQSTFRVLDGQTELVRLQAPAEKVKGYGFSSTVRWKGNESDLTFTIE